MKRFIIFNLIIIFCIIVEPAFVRAGIDINNTALLRQDGQEVVVKVTIKQIATEGSKCVIYDVSGKKLIAISEASRLPVGSGIIDNNGVLTIVYGNPYTDKKENEVYVERLHFISNKDSETMHGAPDPSHPFFVGQYDKTKEPAIIDRRQPVDPDKLAISFIIPYCDNTSIFPIPDGVPWNLLGYQKKDTLEKFTKKVF